MKHATPKTERPPSTQVRKAVAGGSLLQRGMQAGLLACAFAVLGSGCSTASYNRADALKPTTAERMAQTNPLEVRSAAHIFKNPVVRISSVVTHPRNRQVGRLFGSGFIVTTNGYILSNEHVVHHSADGAEWSVSSLSVSIDPDTPRERTFTADVVAFDAGTDIAVLKINCPDSLPCLPLASGTNAAMGDPISIHGYPLGGKFKVMDGKILRFQLPDQKFSVNVLVCVGNAERGSSGGAVLDASGSAVGVTFAKARMDGDRLQDAKALQKAVVDGVVKCFEESSRKMKEQGNTAQAQQVDALGKKVLTDMIPSCSTLDEAAKNPNLTYAVAIKDVRQLLERWKVPLSNTRSKPAVPVVRLRASGKQVEKFRSQQLVTGKVSYLQRN